MTVRNAIAPLELAEAGGGGGGGGANELGGDVLVWEPDGVQGGNVFTSWADLWAVANVAAGPVRIWCTRSTSEFEVPAGHYNFQERIYFDGDPAYSALVRFADGATFSNMAKVGDHVQISNNSTTDACWVFDGESPQTKNVQIGYRSGFAAYTGKAAVFELNGGSTLTLELNGSDSYLFSQTGDAIVTIVVTDTCVISCTGDASSSTDDVVSGAAGTVEVFVYADASDGTLDIALASFAGTLTVTRPNNASQIAYAAAQPADWPEGEPTVANAALDVLAARHGVLVEVFEASDTYVVPAGFEVFEAWLMGSAAGGGGGAGGRGSVAGVQAAGGSGGARSGGSVAPILLPVYAAAGATLTITIGAGGAGGAGGTPGGQGGSGGNGVASSITVAGAIIARHNTAYATGGGPAFAGTTGGAGGTASTIGGIGSGRNNFNYVTSTANAFIGSGAGGNGGNGVNGTVGSAATAVPTLVCVGRDTYVENAAGGARGLVGGANGGGGGGGAGSSAYEGAGFESYAFSYPPVSGAGSGRGGDGGAGTDGSAAGSSANATSGQDGASGAAGRGGGGGGGGGSAGAYVVASGTGGSGGSGGAGSDGFIALKLRYLGVDA